MQHGTSLLLGLPGLIVERVELDEDRARVVHVVTDERWAGLCSACGERSTSVKAHTVTAPKDLPYGPAAVKVLWHKTRWRCRAEQCPQKTFAEQVPSIAPGARTTTRLRHAVAEAVGENRSVAEVAPLAPGVLAHGATRVHSALRVNRRHLLRARERLSSKRFTTMWNACIGLDPSGDLLATWIAKEELRALLGCAKTADRHTIRARLFDFYTWCADTDVPEVHTLATLIETWWPAVLTFLQTGATNAATEGRNRLIKQVKRQACRFRNRSHYRDRGRFHCIRSRERARARTGGLPAQR